jgi:beta-glucanase (GH16 family)
MNRQSWSLLNVACAALTLAGCSALGLRAPGAGRPAGEVVFFDDFAGPKLDPRIWNVEVTGRTVNDEQQAYVDSDEVLRIARGREAEGARNGALVVQAKSSPGFTTAEGKKYDFISGRINTRGKVELAYGTVAARIKLAGGDGLWPAFWALGTGRWPDTGEIDIMEYVGESDWVSAALHGPGYSGETPLVNKLFLRPGHEATDWHVYSVDWTPQGFVFRVDDQVMYRATRAMIEHYGRWAYDNPKFLILNLALGGAYPLKTNGVRSAHPGLPEQTVQLIRDGRARMLVDWVQVTRP